MPDSLLRLPREEVVLVKLTARLTLIFSVLILIIVAGYGYLGTRRQLRLFSTDLERDTRTLARVLASGLRHLWTAGGAGRVQDFLDTLDSEEPRLRVGWTWPVDRTALSSPLGDSIPAEILGRAFRSGELVPVDVPGAEAYLTTFVAVDFPDGTRGILELGESFRERDEYVAATLRRLVLLVIAIFLAATLVAGWLGVRLVGRPVEDLLRKAREIGDGNFEPLICDARDELGLLVEETNRTCRRLEASRRTLEAEEQARRGAEDQLRHAERLATLGGLAAGIAHEMGTPLNVVSGRATMIATGMVQGEEVATSARIIHEQVQRIEATVRQLLVFARREPPRRSPTDLSSMASAVLDLLQASRLRGATELRAELDSEVRATVDPIQIEQVLVNLVLNAFHASAGAGLVVVRVSRVGSLAEPRQGSRDPRGPLTLLEVEDDGPGVPEELRARIFEPFFTTKEVGEGTGLGLSVAHGIVREHGGWIEVGSGVSGGALFRVFLPEEPE